MNAPAPRPSRRRFLRDSSLALAGGSLLTTGLGASPLRRREDELRVGLVGCGGRGTGAAAQALATSPDVRLVALADAFEDRLANCLATLEQTAPEQVEVPGERRFVGFGACQALVEEDLDVVILATPPGFRPQHFEAAVDKGKHVFMEKPVAVDGPGVRRVLAAGERAAAQGLKVGVGLQRHHDSAYLETVKRLQEGAIGDINLLRVYWNSAGVWVRPREAGQSEMEYQMRNWYYFNWLCGDHIVEQHIHNLDVANWVKGATPVRAQGQGGRQVRTGPDHGEIYDHHVIEYTYADGTTLLSQCRHQPGTWSRVGESASGSEGTADIGGARIEAAGGWSWRHRGEVANAYQVEHDRLFAAIRAGTEHDETRTGAEATLTAVLGRMATYSGQVVSWEEALESEMALEPSAYAWDGTPPSLPDAEGRYVIAMPGATRAF